MFLVAKAAGDRSVLFVGWEEGFGSERVKIRLTAPSPIDKVGGNTVQVPSPFTIEFIVLVTLSQRLGASTRLCRKNSGSVVRKESGLF